MKVANALRCLSNTSRGAPPNLLRQAVLACVLPIAYFAAETWWPGLNRISAHGRSISNRVAGHVSLIRKVDLAGARAILPVYRTTPTPVFYRGAGILPPVLELNKRSQQAILRAHQLDPYHPLRKRIRWIKKTRRKISRPSSWTLSFPDTEFMDPLILSPWTLRENWCAGIKRISRHPFLIPRGIPIQDIVVYSHASRPETASGPRLG